MGNAMILPSSPTTQANVDVNLLENELPNGKEYDIFRDSYVRYLGYTNEVGEAFRRHISSKLLFASYAFATTYVCADSLHKGYRSFSKGQGTTKALIQTGDAFVWQMFASILLPGYTINRITYLARRLVRLKRKKCICKASPFVRYTPVAVGLLTIPFIIHPIDNSVTWMMDRTVRLLYSEPKNEKTATDPKNGE